MKNELTQERLKELLHYDPETGDFIRKISVSGTQAGHIVSNKVNSSGYRNISVDGKHYQSSRLAWLYMKGYFPEHEIDHINRIKNDDRWANLRHVTRQCNLRNKSRYSNNKSSVTGVHWDSESNKWSASVRINGTSKKLGKFENFTDAVEARWEGEKKHNFPKCNTTSSAYLHMKENGGRRMLEKQIEKALCKRVKKLGGLCEKFVSPSRRSVPDRVVTLPDGRIIFVELKSEGKKPTENQKRDHLKRRLLGCDVRVIDCLEDVEIFPEEG